MPRRAAPTCVLSYSQPAPQGLLRMCAVYRLCFVQRARSAATGATQAKAQATAEPAAVNGWGDWDENESCSSASERDSPPKPPRQAAQVCPFGAEWSHALPLRSRCYVSSRVHCHGQVIREELHEASASIDMKARPAPRAVSTHAAPPNLTVSAWAMDEVSDVSSEEDF